MKKYIFVIIISLISQIVMSQINSDSTTNNKASVTYYRAGYGISSQSNGNENKSSDAYAEYLDKVITGQNENVTKNSTVKNSSVSNSQFDNVKKTYKKIGYKVSENEENNNSNFSNVSTSEPSIQTNVNSSYLSNREDLTKKMSTIKVDKNHLKTSKNSTKNKKPEVVNRYNLYKEVVDPVTKKVKIIYDFSSERHHTKQ